MNKKHSNTNKKGFTIVELLIAMAIFQIVLVLSMFAYLNISKYYQKTINSNRLQQVTNNTVDEIARSIQSTGGLLGGSYLTAIDVDTNAGNVQDKTDTKTVTTNLDMTIGGTSFKVTCIDTTRYFYRLNVREQGGAITNYANHAFMSDQLNSPNTCATASPGSVSALRLILGQDMWLYGFAITNNGSLYNISINAVYTSESDDVDTTNLTASPPYVSCKGGTGRQFCAASNVSTTVTRRIAL